jgi:hypothetical protein
MRAQPESIEKTNGDPDTPTHTRVSGHQPAPCALLDRRGLSGIQQAAGNLAVQRLFHSGMIQAKLTLSQPEDVYEQEADRVAERITRMSHLHLSERGSQETLPRAETHFSQVRSFTTQTLSLFRQNLGIQRLVDEGAADSTSASTAPTTETSPAPPPSDAIAQMTAPKQTPSPGFIVEDSMEDLTPGQMRRGEFLSQLRTAVSNTIEAAIPSPAGLALVRPQMEQQLAGYYALDAQSLERTIRSDAPETAGATTANGYISIICERVRQTVASAQTAETPGPEGAGRVLPQVAAMSSGLVSSLSNIFLKRREGGARQPSDPQAIQAQLGPGRSLDGSVSSRMTRAFGQDFSHVRVHTDANAVELSTSLNARAFTLGEHIAFGAGEYQPGTMIGDALIAHELAHVMQQSGATASAPLPKGETGHDSLEEEADHSAVGALVSLWGQAKAGLADLGQQAMPRLRSGLRLQRCAKKPTPAPEEEFNLPNHPNPLSAPGERILFSSVFRGLRPTDFETIYTGVGGHFDALGSGPLEKKFPGHGAANLSFFIDSTWDGKTPVSVEMQIKRLSDGLAVRKKTWNFEIKPYFPTTISQVGDEDEKPIGLGGNITYVYQVGPERDAQGNPRTYERQTILERFEGATCNIERSELKPEFQAAHPELTTPEKIAAHFYNPTAFNATFTVDRSNAFADVNGENNVNQAWAPVMNALMTKKDVYFDHTQVFEAKPGVPLGRYVIRRILRHNGAMAMKKSPL